MIPVHVIGMGMSPEDITPRAMDRIRDAQVLVGGKRHLGFFREHPARKIELSKNYKLVLDEIHDLAFEKKVVVLASGDPNYYGIGPRLVESLGSSNVVVLPNVTTVQAAFSRLGLSWQDCDVVSLHGRPLEALLRSLRTSDKIAIYTDRENTPDRIARFLVENDIEGFRLCVFEDLGVEKERVTWWSPVEAQNQSYSELNLVVLMRTDDAPAPKLYFGMPEESYDHERGLITKAEIRCVVLSKLMLSPSHVLWDIGAGSGSVGIEASLFLPKGKVFTVESKPERALQIEKNRRRMRALNLEVHNGEAPECLSGLPDPDRVFIGGGGHAVEPILGAVVERIRRPGVIVLTAAMMETVQRANEFLRSRSWDVDGVMIQVNRMQSMKHGTRLEAANPVWILAAKSK